MGGYASFPLLFGYDECLPQLVQRILTHHGADEDAIGLEYSPARCPKKNKYLLNALLLSS